MTTSIRFAGVARYQESIRGLCGAILIALAMAIPARADSIGTYTLFAGHAIQATGGITATAGVIGSNGDMYLNGATAQTVRGGGSIFDVFGGVTTTGDVTVNGNAQLTFFGGIGGNLNVGQNAYTSANVAGNIRAGNNVTTSGNTTGSIFAGGSITSTGTVSGSTNPFTAANPTAFSNVALPAAHAFSSGGTSLTLTSTQSLAPASYGGLVLNGATLNLTAGNYYFSDITMTGGATFNFNTTQGPINIYVTGSVYLNGPSMNLNGIAVSNVSSAATSQVYWETHGNFRLDGNLLGTVYAPSGDIQVLGLSTVNGDLIAGNDLVITGGNFITGTQSAALTVPEPAGLTLSLFALAGLSFARWRKARRRHFPAAETG